MKYRHLLNFLEKNLKSRIRQIFIETGKRQGELYAILISLLAITNKRKNVYAL